MTAEPRILNAMAANAVAVAAIAVAAVCGSVVCVGDAMAQTPANAAAGDGKIHPYHVQGNVWLMAGEPDGVNVAIQVGSDGVVVVDTGVQSMATLLLERINDTAMSQAGFRAAEKPVHIIIDTDARPDHVGGNQIIREGGSTLMAGNAAFDQSFNPGAPVWANENVQARMLAPDASGKPSVPTVLWPTQLRYEDLYSITYNGEPVQLYHPHRAITDGGTMVMFRGSNVLVTGDVLSMLSYPTIDVKAGGSIDGELVALNRILELAVAGPYEEGGTMIVPGRGHLCDQADAVHYRNMITAIRDRIQFYKNQGKTLAQVLALKPSADTDARWGATSGPWTTTQFIEAVYATLPAKGAMFSMRTDVIVPADAKDAGHSREVF
jgi:glyoxylase-like metal-dependent hydrolase (beta-lactamase superfamily II)